MNREELAWAAGLFDGEGNVRLIRKHVGSQRGQPHLSIAQVNPIVLQRFRDAVGIGKVYGPYLQRTANRRPYFVYSGGGFPSIQAVIAMIWSFLSPVKKEQARTTLSAYHAIPAGKSGRPRKKVA